MGAWQSMTPQNQLFIIVGGSLIGLVALIAGALAVVGASSKKKAAPPTTLPDMDNGKVFPYIHYIKDGMSYQDSPSACVNHFLTPSNKTRIDVIQYDHNNGKCIASNAGYIEGGTYMAG